MSRPKTYVVTLTDAQRAHVLAFLKKGAAKARMLTRARILLCSAEGKTDRLIADLLQVTPETVRNIRKRCATAGLEAALQERPRPGAQPNLDSTPEALRVALACSAPPEGREHWTMHLLADRLVELEVAESISDEPVRRVVNQTNASPGRSGSGASDRARLRFSGGWTMGATAPPNPPIPSARLSAWTNDRLNCWRMVGSPYRWNQVNPNGWMMHTSATARATCSCFSNPGAAGGPSTRRSGGRTTTLPGRCSGWWTRRSPQPRAAGSCWITGTPIRLLRCSRPSRRRRPDG